MIGFIWTGDRGQAVINNYRGAFYNKPKLGFEFDNLMFEPDLVAPFKVIGAVTTPLTKEEFLTCNTFISDFFDTQDYDVYPYDDLGISTGVARKSECTSVSVEYALVQPQGLPLEKFSNGEWHPVYATLNEHGRISIRPDHICDACVEVFTEEEFQAIDLPTYYHEVWDFKARKWVDGRKLDESKRRAEHDIRAAQNDPFTMVKHDEYPFWPVQLQEAQAYTNDPQASTPFIDGMLQEYTGQTKESVCSAILEHYSPSVLTALGRAHGKAYKYIKAIRSSTTLVELDKVMTEQVIKDFPYIHWLQPFNHY